MEVSVKPVTEASVPKNGNKSANVTTVPAVRRQTPSHAVTSRRAMLRSSTAREPGPAEVRQLFSALCDGRADRVHRFFRGRYAAHISLPFFRTLPHMHHSGFLYDAQPPGQHEGATCLHVCAWLGHLHIVAWLVARGASLDAKDAHHRTPLQVSTQRVSTFLTWSREPSPYYLEYVSRSRPAITMPSRDEGATIDQLLSLSLIDLNEESTADWPHHEQECAICFVAFTDKVGSQAAQMPVCKHVFCATCLRRWLCDHSSCPMCRTRLSGAKVEGCSMAAEA